jgi:ribosomal protein L40E
VSEVNTTLTLKCSKCGASIVSTSDINTELQTKVTNLVRAGQVLEAARLLKISAHIGIAEAKTIAFHVTKQKGFCHRCKAKIDVAVGECPKCHSLNFDW